MALAQEIIDSYSELDLRPGATEAQAKAAYHRLAKALHPDLHPGSLGVMMSRVNKAYKKVMAHLASQQRTADLNYRHFDLEEFIGTDFINHKRQAKQQHPEPQTTAKSESKQPQPKFSPPVPFITLRCGSKPQTAAATTLPPRSRDHWRLMELGRNENGLLYRVLVQGRPASMDLPVRNHRPCSLCAGTGCYTASGQAQRCPSCGGRGSITSSSTVHVTLPPSWGHGEKLPVNLSGGGRAFVELMTISPGGEA